MRPIGELTGGAVAHSVDTAVAPVGPADERGQSPSRYVFLRMHGAYGAQWLDKWRTGLLDAEGKDRGVASVMAQWDVALGGFSRETIAKACDAVQDEARRPDHRFPPSMPEFLAQCRALSPRRQPPPVALPDLVRVSQQLEGRERLAEIRRAALIEPKKVGPLERMHDLIVEAYQNAGGQIEDLVTWSMLRQAGD